MDDVSPNEILSNHSVGDGKGGTRRLTWQELAERCATENARLQIKASMLDDLTRCEHGRHEGDACSLSDGHCVGGVSLGNPVVRADPERIIGYYMSGKPIRVPGIRENWEDVNHGR